MKNTIDRLFFSVDLFGLWLGLLSLRILLDTIVRPLPPPPRVPRAEELKLRYHLSTCHRACLTPSPSM